MQLLVHLLEGAEIARVDHSGVDQVLDLAQVAALELEARHLQLV